MSALPAQSSLLVRPVRAGDGRALHELVASAGVFSAEEIASAIEIIDSAVAAAERGPLDSDYQILVAEAPELIGYLCFGRTPFTLGAWDLYWLATHPERRRLGAARALCVALEALALGRGGTHIRVETSGTPAYGPARAVYEGLGYRVMARIPNFYKPGDDLVTLCKELSGDDRRAPTSP